MTPTRTVGEQAWDVQRDVAFALSRIMFEEMQYLSPEYL